MSTVSEPVVAAEQAANWPAKYSLFGVPVTAATCDEICDAIMVAAHRRQPAIVSAFAVHALMEACNRDDLRPHVQNFDVITPDGQPVRWALNLLHGARLKHNVRGSELMWQLCRRAADEGVSIYLYGSTEKTLAALADSLTRQFPQIQIVEIESPPFRALSPQEDADMVRRVNESGAGMMFLGLGCPKQDYFAAAHAGQINAVQLCVGAAFDFHAGNKATAPMWMQRRGLEWLFRLATEPRRLWKRYLVTNTQYLARLTGALLTPRARRNPSRGATSRTFTQDM